MREVSITSASYIGPEGYGNLRGGLHAWPLDLRKDLSEGHLEKLHWSLISNSDPGRFGRMDLLSRVGLMAVKLLDHHWEAMSPAERDQTAVLIETFTGCLCADVQFLKTPRASLFSYTLPSTVLGEICIRYHLRGPQACQIKSNRATTALAVVNHSGILREAVDLLDTDEASACLCVSCDVFDTDTARALGSPSLAGWQAGALLLERGAGLQVPTEGDTILLCRKLVRDL